MEVRSKTPKMKVSNLANTERAFIAVLKVPSRAGRFKKYFVFTTNCVLLSDYLIRNEEIDLLNMSGIITPGAYLNYLFQLYIKKDSIIKRLKIYKKSPNQKETTI